MGLNDNIYHSPVLYTSLTSKCLIKASGIKGDISALFGDFSFTNSLFFEGGYNKEKKWNDK